MWPMCLVFKGIQFRWASNGLAADLVAKKVVVAFLPPPQQWQPKSLIIIKNWFSNSFWCRFNRAVRFWLERFDDMAISGNRHPFRFDYRFALDEKGKFAAMEVNAFSNCGYSLDLSKGVMGNWDNIHLWILIPNKKNDAFVIWIMFINLAIWMFTDIYAGQIWPQIRHFVDLVHRRQCSPRKQL